jgi:hypothetical protein
MTSLTFSHSSLNKTPSTLSPRQIAARFDGQSLAKIVASLTGLRDWERGSKAVAGAGNDR